MRGGWVYLLANRYRGTIYTGVTADLARRSWQHRHGRGSKFVAKYDGVRLVYVEEYPTIEEAIAREKAIRKWLRLEDRTDRESQSGVARPLRQSDWRLKEAGLPLSRE